MNHPQPYTWFVDLNCLYSACKSAFLWVLWSKINGSEKLDSWAPVTKMKYYGIRYSWIQKFKYCHCSSAPLISCYRINSFPITAWHFLLVPRKMASSVPVQSHQREGCLIPPGLTPPSHPHIIQTSFLSRTLRMICMPISLLKREKWGAYVLEHIQTVVRGYQPPLVISLGTD